MNTKKLILLLLYSLFLLPGQVICMDNEIFKAIQNDDIKKVKLLLDSDVKVNCRHVREKRFFFDLFNSSNVWSEYTPLLYASANDKLEIIILLLKFGADINLEDNLGSTARNFSIPEIKFLLDNAENAGDLVKKNKFEDLYQILSKKTLYDNYLLYYALFQIKSKKQFQRLREEYIKNGISDVKQLIYSDISPRLLKRFLRLNIWTWEHKMFKIFPTLGQKKEMIAKKYQYNDKTISQIPYYDLKIHYNNQIMLS